jgi:hypothetical protein
MQDHQAQDAVEFTDDQKRDEATRIVIDALVNRPSEALDSYTKDVQQFDMVYSLISELVRANEFVMGVLVTNAMRIHEETIQRRLEQEYE